MKKRHFVFVFILSIFIVSAGVSNIGSEDLNFDIGTENSLNFSVFNEWEENITEVRVILPEQLSFVLNSNLTNATADFFNEANVLIWNSSDEVVLVGEMNYFSFNVSAVENGSSVIIFNITYNETNTTSFEIIVYPYVRFLSSTPANNSNLSVSYIVLNAGVSSALEEYNATAYLYNSSLILVSNITKNESENSIFNFTDLAEGSYYYNLSVVDSYGGENITETRKVNIDRTAPSISSFSTVVLNRTNFNMSFTVSDGGTGVQTCAKVSGTGSLVYNAGNTNYISASSLSCNTQYNFNISCTDYAGNVAYKNANYITSSCESSSSSSSSSSNQNYQPAAPSFWTNTFVDDDVELTDKGEFSRDLAIKQRVRLKIKNRQHFVGIIELKSSSAVVNVSSTPQQAEISIGNEKSFDVDDDGYYDIIVRVDSIESNKAKIFLRATDEKVNAVSSTGSSDSLGEKTLDTGEKSSSKVWLIVLIVIIIFLIGSFIGWKILDKEKRRKGLK